MTVYRLLAFVAIVLAALAALTSVASAAPLPATPPVSLGFEPSGDAVGFAAGASPSREHAWGTANIAWCEVHGDVSSIVLGEWSLREAQWARRRAVRSGRFVCPLTIHLARSADRLFMVTGAPTEEVELVAFQDFVERGAVRLADGFAPSLDADARYVVVSTFESQKQVLATNPSSPVAQPSHALHARVFDPSTLQIVGARMFRGDHLLRPHAVPAIASHALRLMGERLYVQVPDDDPHVVAVRLPSLKTERDRAFRLPRSFVTPYASSVALERVGDTLVVGLDVVYVLDARLDVIAKRTVRAAAPGAGDDEADPRKLTVHGRAVELGPLDPRSPRWAIRVGR